MIIIPMGYDSISHKHYFVGGKIIVCFGIRASTRVGAVTILAHFKDDIHTNCTLNGINGAFPFSICHSVLFNNSQRGGGKRCMNCNAVTGASHFMICMKPVIKKNVKLST